MNTPLSQLTTSAAAFAQPERTMVCRKCGAAFTTTSRVAKACSKCSRYAQIQRGKGAAK